MYLQHYIMAIIYLVFTAFYDGFYLSIINIMSVLQLITITAGFSITSDRFHFLPSL